MYTRRQWEGFTRLDLSSVCKKTHASDKLHQIKISALKEYQSGSADRPMSKTEGIVKQR